MAQTPPKAGNPLMKSKERIYTPHQLIMALKSGMVSVREQLQVLSILDGTAASWPGINQAVEDMDFLVEMSAQTSTRLESEIKTSEARAHEFKMEVMTLKETLSNSSQRFEELQQEVSQGLQEIRQVGSNLP
jgi:chromosome segregation ATPase